MKTRLFLVSCLVAFAPAVASVHANSDNRATRAAPRNPWMQQHEKFNDIAKKGDVDLVFLGDSITQGWRSNAGKAAWAANFASLKAANFGISGDGTQHVLWRVRNGNFDGIKPKAAVLMIGTNNTGYCTPEQIAEGVTEIVKEIHARSPSTQVLLLGIFPRGQKPTDPLRIKVGKVNEILAKLHDGKTVHYLDIGQKFLQPDGTITREMMHDFLHLSPTAYSIWAESIKGKVAELLK